MYSESLYYLQSVCYSPNPLEHGSQQVIRGINILTNIGLYISPIVVLYLWKNGCTLESASAFSLKLTAGFSLLVLVSVILRGIGRALNPSYNTFLEDINKANIAHSKSSPPYSILANKYDCDFSALFLTYKLEKNNHLSDSSFLSRYFTPSGLIAVLLGRPLIYPGSIKLLQARNKIMNSVHTVFVAGL